MRQLSDVTVARDHVALDGAHVRKRIYLAWKHANVREVTFSVEITQSEIGMCDRYFLEDDKDVL